MLQLSQEKLPCQLQSEREGKRVLYSNSSYLDVTMHNVMGGARFDVQIAERLRKTCEHRQALLGADSR